MQRLGHAVGTAVGLVIIVAVGAATLVGTAVLVGWWARIAYDVATTGRL